MNKRIISLGMLGALFCTLFFSSSILAHSRAATAMDSTSLPNRAQICYDLQDENGSWLPQEDCDSTLVAPAGGIYGIGIRLQGADANRHVHYQAWVGAIPLAEKQDGDKLYDPSIKPQPITQLKITLAPRQGSAVSILAIDNNFTIYNMHDNQDVGDRVTPLRVIQLRYTF